MRKKEDLSNFLGGIIVGARQAGLSVSPANLLGFPCTAISRVYRERLKKRKKKKKTSSEQQIIERQQ